MNVLDFFLETLHARPQAPMQKIRTLHYLQHETKSLQYTIDVLASLEKQIRSDIVEMGGPSFGLETIMDVLHVDPALLHTFTCGSPTSSVE